MSWPQCLTWAAKWGTVFVLPAPIALAACHARIVDIGPLNWGIVNSWLFDLYNSIGLRNVPYLYSWSWITVFMAQIGVPYAIFVLIAHNWPLQNRCPFYSLQNMRRLLKCYAIAVLAVPLTLIVLRILLPVFDLYHLVPRRFVAENETARYWVGLLGLLLHIGIPHAAVCLTMQALLGWLRESRNRTAKTSK
jgi:hypothetical protein